MFPLPFMIKAKYLVGIWIFIAIVATFDPAQGGVASFAHLGGLLFGFLFVKFLPSRGLSYAASERYFGFRNSDYRWKRKRAGKKFEVYMRDHDRKVTFDEHGNYVPRMRTIRPMAARNRAGSISEGTSQLSAFSSQSLKSVSPSEAKDLLLQRQKISWERGCERRQHAIRKLLFSSLALKPQIMPSAL